MLLNRSPPIQVFLYFPPYFDIDFIIFVQQSWGLYLVHMKIAFIYFSKKKNLFLVMQIFQNSLAEYKPLEKPMRIT